MLDCCEEEHHEKRRRHRLTPPHPTPALSPPNGTYPVARHHRLPRVPLSQSLQSHSEKILVVKFYSKFCKGLFPKFYRSFVRPHRTPISWHPSTRTHPASSPCTGLAVPT